MNICLSVCLSVLNCNKMFSLVQDSDVTRIRKLFPALKQSSCLGDNDAMYVVAVILNNGFLVKADEMQVSTILFLCTYLLFVPSYFFIGIYTMVILWQALAYLMMAALDNHRLSFLAIGNKHKNGLDTVPKDLDQAYSRCLSIITATLYPIYSQNSSKYWASDFTLVIS